LNLCGAGGDLPLCRETETRRIRLRSPDPSITIVEQAGGGNYQTLINDALLTHTQQKSMLQAVRQVVREEVGKSTAVLQSARKKQSARARHGAAVG
jgi:uncharacterized protein (DUF4415 family)